MALEYGSIDALIAEIYATVVAEIAGIIITYQTAKTGLNTNLKARGGGFVYSGERDYILLVLGVKQVCVLGAF
ncbi:hypothetical protein [Bacillus sp. PK3_68]|uniref:hypothetical protein n=1 Tax=Bacillus sp. PK3_68 TaxID=2027408 RepID=UPI000E710304|nr:hypothetical protein [Bacillus sp. PK3_68]RJS50166.1 hypothetical protein CJ483_23070 [Bacillus sp. PK3_68]